MQLIPTGSREGTPADPQQLHVEIAENPHDILLEQYRLYVEMADRVSSRRTITNQFYVSVLTALFAVVAIFLQRQPPAPLQSDLLFGASALGIGLCYIWAVNIRAYRQLNTAKFMVITELEQQFDFHGFQREWEIAKSSLKKHVEFTRVEPYVALLLAIPYMLLFVYALAQQ